MVIEVVGHDHYADIRYHSSLGVLDLEDTPTHFEFHNMLVAPGITPNKNSQPGVATFEVSADGVPSKLRMEFLDLVPLLGTSSVGYSDLKFLSLALSEYGLTDLTADALSVFRSDLEANKDMTLEYLVRKLGYDHTNANETQMALDMLAKIDLITSTKHKTGEYICSMHKSLSPDEFNTCCSSANTFAELFLQ